MDRFRVVLGNVLVLATVLAAAIFASDSLMAKGAVERFDRVECTSLGFAATELGDGVECGWLTVPESRGKSGRDLRLAVVIARATSKGHAKEPMLYLHGGPGIATLDVIPRALRGKSWPLLRENHDLVFFDQRGTGRSAPAICPDFNATMTALAVEGLSPIANSKAQLAAAKKCRVELRKLNVDTASYSSTEIANDVEALRITLGVSRWNIFATSFGSLPASELLRNWPLSVRSVILDSAFPPNSSNRVSLVGATAESFAAFQHRCDKITGCSKNYGDFRKSAAEISGRLDRSPILTKTGRVTGDKFRDALWTLMVDGSTVQYLPELLNRAGNGDDDLIQRFVTVFGDTGYFGGYAHAQAWLLNCHDIFPRPSQPMLKQTMAENPDMASSIIPAAQDAMCNTLQPLHAKKAFYRPFENQTPTLILFGEFDPATPYSDAVTAQQFFANTELIEVGGASHAPFYTDACTKGIALAFLANPDVSPDKSCLGKRDQFEFATAAEFDEFASSLPSVDDVKN